MQYFQLTDEKVKSSAKTNSLPHQSDLLDA
jgi:hypothetical protein